MLDRDRAGRSLGDGADGGHEAIVDPASFDGGICGKVIFDKGGGMERSPLGALAVRAREDMVQPPLRLERGNWEW